MSEVLRLLDQAIAELRRALKAQSVPGYCSFELAELELARQGLMKDAFDNGR